MGSMKFDKTDFAIANMLFREKKYDDAIELYKKAVEKNPDIRDIVSINIKLCREKLGNVIEQAEIKKSDNVFIGIAAIPEREEALKKTIESLIDQVPSIGVYLNGWKKIPEFLRQEKITIAGYGDKDLGDVGKFYWVDSHDGIYFTCDDDLIYPKDYVKRTLAKLEEHSYNAVIGWHGSLIKKPFKDYYSPDSRRVFVFSAHRPYDTPVHILGTGCSAFHTQVFPIKLRDFIYPNMADIFLSLKGQEKKLPFIVIKHEKGEIFEVEGSKDSSIYAHSHAGVDSKKNTKEIQNKFVSEHKEWLTYNFKKISILIIGRFDSYMKGGIYKSCHLIKNHLMKLGHEVSVVDTKENFEKLKLSKYDICWIYPGDPERPDFETVDEKISLLQSLDIPVIVNLSYLYETSRTQWIAEKIRQYNSRTTGAPVLAAVFTETAANDPLLSDVRDFVCVVPKTLLPTPYDSTPKFEDREGICLGDATKLGNKRIIGGSINKWVDEIHKRLPHVNLYAYKQYQGKDPHPKIKYIPHMKEEFGEWLAHRKLFICSNVHLTFEMVACEAQQYGTPTIYRHMPHSLSEYISATGIAVRTPEEMGEMVSWLYNNKDAWEKISKSSVYNASSKNVNLMDASLEGYLRLAIYRAKKIAGLPAFKKNST